MLEGLLEQGKKYVECLVLASAVMLAGNGCAKYRAMDVRTARAGAVLPDLIKNKVLSVAYDTIEKKLEEHTCSYDEYKVCLKEKGLTVTEFECIESKIGNKERWMILYPILGGEDLLLVGHIARSVFAGMGINSAIVLRKELLIPDEGPYRPLKSNDPEKIDFEKYVDLSLNDTARIMNYVKTQGMEEFGFLGISLGGMQVVGSAAVFDESKINVMVMAGGNISEVLLTSKEKPVARYKEHLLKEYGSEEKVRTAVKTLRIEPLLFTKYVATERARMVITTNDDVVPSSCQWLLYESLGRPSALVVPSNHYTLIMHYFSVRNFIIGEVGKAFGLEEE